MIDWALALRLNEDDSELVNRAFETVEYVWRSMNQSLTDFIRECPIFVDLELKKELSLRDPEVQLAVWASAGLLKKRQMQWSTELPMPGIVVDGHIWTSYLFFEQNEKLVSLPLSSLLTISQIRLTISILDYAWANYHREHEHSTWHVASLLPAYASGGMGSDSIP